MGEEENFLAPISHYLFLVQLYVFGWDHRKCFLFYNNVSIDSVPALFLFMQLFLKGLSQQSSWYSGSHNLSVPSTTSLSII